MGRNPNWRLVLLTASVAAAAACGDATEPDSGGLELNRLKWESSGPSSYTYEFQRGCFCGTEWVTPVRITVHDGRVTGAVFVATGQPVPAVDVDRFYSVTVDSLFGTLAEALRRSADDIRVRYDRALGYPRVAFIDYDFRTADEELGFTAQLVSPP